MIRREPAETTTRYRDLATMQRARTLSAAEQRELEALVAASEALAPGNARALLRHRDPAAYEVALAEERRIRRR